MKFKYFIMLFAALLSFTTIHAASIPTVAQVELTIASGDYTKARKQLGEVLEVNPNSYVANRYMFEIIKIENGRDNISSVEYKLYEDKVNKITQQIEQRKAAEAKAIQDKKDKERRQAIMKALYWLVAIGLLLGLSHLLYVNYKSYKARKLKEKEFQELCDQTTATLLDLEVAFQKLSLIPLIEDDELDLKALSEDNADAISQVLKKDFNQDLVKKHIYYSKEFLESHGIEV